MRTINFFCKNYKTADVKSSIFLMLLPIDNVNIAFFPLTAQQHQVILRVHIFVKKRRILAGPESVFKSPQFGWRIWANRSLLNYKTIRVHIFVGIKYLIVHPWMLQKIEYHAASPVLYHLVTPSNSRGVSSDTSCASVDSQTVIAPAWVQSS